MRLYSNASINNLNNKLLVLIKSERFLIELLYYWLGVYLVCIISITLRILKIFTNLPQKSKVSLNLLLCILIYILKLELGLVLIKVLLAWAKGVEVTLIPLVKVFSIYNLGYNGILEVSLHFHKALMSEFQGISH